MAFYHGDGRSKYPRTNVEERDGSGSSKHSSRHIKFDDGGGSSEGSENSKHSRRHLEFDGSDSNHFEINPEIIIKGWELDGSESSKRSEVIQEEIDRTEGTKLRLSSSSSSSSSGSSTDQEDIKLSMSRLGISSTSSHKPADDTQHHVSGENGSAGPASTSQVPSVTHESTLTQSPPVQVMDRQGEFDSQRIPSTVFARSKSSTLNEWSIASNDSLFSIPVGNNSFSRDQVLSVKSGELFKSDEFIALSPSPVVPAAGIDKKSGKSDKKEAVLVSEDAVKNKAGTSVIRPTVEKTAQPAVSWNASTISSHSADSPTSARSFAFPIGEKKKKNQKQEFACPLCYCSNCGRACCCLSYCSWTFCYCWNCSIKRCLSDAKNISKKEKEVQQQQQQQQQQHEEEEEQQQKQPLASAASSKSVFCRCCSWFPSCRWRWHCHWSCSRNCCRRKCC